MNINFQNLIESTGSTRRYVVTENNAATGVVRKVSQLRGQRLHVEQSTVQDTQDLNRGRFVANSGNIPSIVRTCSIVGTKIMNVIHDR